MYLIVVLMMGSRFQRVVRPFDVLVRSCKTLELKPDRQSSYGPVSESRSILRIFLHLSPHNRNHQTFEEEKEEKGIDSFYLLLKYHTCATSYGNLERKNED